MGDKKGFVVVVSMVLVLILLAFLLDMRGNNPVAVETPVEESPSMVTPAPVQSAQPAPTEAETSSALTLEPTPIQVPNPPAPLTTPVVIEGS